MTLLRDGEQVSSGTGEACLGDPLNAVAWLANTAAKYGAPLRAGDIILSGALGPLAPVGPGQTLEATISTLGTVTASFSGGDDR
jgi:2-keto-4-pentenoate hydratase